MVLLIPLILILSSWIPFLNPGALSLAIHNQCLNLISFDSPWIDIYEALICGEKLPNSYIKDTFSKGGLIHLMVISGAHLLFLEKLFNTIPLPHKIKNISLYLILVLYTFAALIRPPVTRALFGFCLWRFSESHKLFLSSTFRVHLSGFLCLLYNPSWIHSISLQLSWLASLSQSAKKPFTKYFLTYFTILPIINRWQELHPLTIVINWIFAPMIGSVLFPLSVCSLWLPPLHRVIDHIWNFILYILQAIGFLATPIPLLNWSIPSQWTVLYMSLVMVLLYIMSTYKRWSLYRP